MRPTRASADPVASGEQGSPWHPIVPARLWGLLRASFWFTPGLIVLASMVAGMALVEFDGSHSLDLARWSPRLFGAGADGSRAMLSAIATSMITVAGVVFSITIVALSLTSTQYSPRVLRTFMRDRPTQVVLGVFVGIFAYCLVVLRTIRGGDEGAFIPSVAVFGGMIYAFAGIAVLIYFIHHVALGIQSSSILDRIAADTAAAIDNLFPQELGDPADAPRVPPEALPLAWTDVRAQRSGYVESMDPQALLRAAVEEDQVLWLCPSVGDYVVEGAVLVRVGVGTAAGLSQQQMQRLRAAVVLGRQRSIDQDAAFGLQQLVDVALRALSPGVNDPTTACMCLDQLGRLLARLAGRAMADPYRMEQGRLRVIAAAPDFASLAVMALRPILRHARGEAQVLAAVAGTLATVSDAARSPRRRQALAPLAADLLAELGRLRPRRQARTLSRRVAGMERLLRAGLPCR